MSSSTTFFWHDYESFGIDPARDRPAQFAGIRTDWQLNPIGEPLMIYCQPGLDYLPQPAACMITGIDPALAWQQGVPEAEFIARIEYELKQPGTCGVGYNSIRFDDEVTRHTLYRNLRDPYAREWQNGCSRWDILDMVRLVRLMQPDALVWPEVDGRVSIKLEHLTQTNGVGHDKAHDALSDVEATIALARLIKTRAPKLFDYCLSLRDKREVQGKLDIFRHKPVLHISGMFPTERMNAAVLAPLMSQPGNANGIVLFDLSQPAQVLLDTSAEELERLLYTPTDQLPPGQVRPALKTLHINRSPVVMGVNKDIADKLALSLESLQANLTLLRQHTENWKPKLEQIYQRKPATELQASDPDLMLYSGGFFSASDKRLMQSVIDMPAEQLRGYCPPFQDGRLEEMLFRYRARSFPQHLSEAEKAQWIEFCHERITDGRAGALTLEAYRSELEALLADESLTQEKHLLLRQLQEYGNEVERCLAKAELQPAAFSRR
ncbi:exodeoxyribonuclease I [Pokkaliibacter plantistimulans]|uniref:Exodeoxyribonuclease I n=1 Tax=Proteobacteria bacterium 228 TaxID=2083153 RepID=A0A2S5KUL8_9PROT|nr:exodeoxyribonuclease I [Pokkaliibacter plantistimulans]PPC78365.1 exodeoxyribonuclease I [Pokkaliibacter plantistimulans]